MAQIELKRHNLRRIVEFLRDAGSASQADIAQRLELQRSTVSNLIRELRDRGWVWRVGKGTPGPSGGKRPDLLSLDSGNGSILSWTVKRDRLVTHVARYPMLLEQTTEREIDAARPDHVIEMIAAEARETRDNHSRLLACGIAVSSIVDATGGIRQSTDFPWQIPGFRERVHSLLPENTALVVENDANCAAVYAHHELRNGGGSILVLYLSEEPRALGAGLIIGGSLVRGRAGGAGEIVRSSEPGFFRSVWPGVRAAVQLVDPEMLVLASRGSRQDPAAARLHDALEQTFPETPLELLSAPDVPGLGALYLASELVTSRIVEEEL